MGSTERSAVFGFCPSNLPIIDQPPPTSDPPDANGWRSRYLSSGNYTTSLPVKRFVQSTTGGGVCLQPPMAGRFRRSRWVDRDRRRSRRRFWRGFKRHCRISVGRRGSRRRHLLGFAACAIVLAGHPFNSFVRNSGSSPKTFVLPIPTKIPTNRTAGIGREQR